MTLRATASVLLLLGAAAGPPGAAAQIVAVAVPSPGQYVHYERDVTNLPGDSWSPGEVRVMSTVPVTVHMHSDDYFDGEQPGEFVVVRRCPELCVLVDYCQ